MKGLEPIANLLKAALPCDGDTPVAPDIQQRLIDFWRAQPDTAEIPSWPLLFTSGRLVVFVESAPWGNELRHRSPSLIAALVRHGLRVTSLSVKIRPHSLPPARKISRLAKSPPKISLENGKQIESLAASIEHPRLKRSLLDLAKRGGRE